MPCYITSRFRFYCGVLCWLCSTTGLPTVSTAILSFTIQPKSSVFVQRNRGFTINCSATGKPMPNVTWTKDDIALVSSSDIKVTKSGLWFVHGVRESRVGSTRVGIFRCLVSNSAGVLLSQKIAVDVIYLRNISLSLHPPMVGNTARLKCTVSSNTPVDFTWFRNNQTVNTTHDGRITVLPSGALQIRDFGSSDNGNYVCRADNEYEGITSSPFYVVKQASTTTRLDIYPSKAVNITVGDRLIIECVRTGSILTNLSWRKMSTPQTNTVLASGANIANLVFESIRVSDGGAYVCQGDDGMRENVSVFVQVPPSFPSPLQAKVNKEDKLVLECAPKGMPAPSITWYRNGQRLVQTAHKLMLGDVTMENSGVYQCEAENELDSSIAFTILDVAAMIGPPTNVKASPLSETEVYVTWSSPSGYKGKHTYFSVHYYDIITHNELQFTTKDHTYTIEHLEEYREYIVYVSVIYLRPQLRPPRLSQMVIVRTLQKEPTGPPLNVQLKSYRRGTLDITWLPPCLEEQNGNVTGYDIAFYAEVDKQLHNFTLVKKFYSLTLTKLAEGERYFVKVAARTSKGLGPFSEEISYVVPRKSPIGVILPAPTISTKLANSSIVVSVKSPVNVNVRGYEMTYRNMRDKDVPYKKVVIYTRTFEYSLENLEVNSEYVIIVRAKGTGVTSARPAIVVVATEKRYPVINPDNKTMFDNETIYYGILPPRSLTCDHAEESTALVLRWKMPHLKSGKTRYRIKYFPENSKTRPKFIFTSHLNLTLTGLSPGEEYNVKIQSTVSRSSKIFFSLPPTKPDTTTCLLPEKKPASPPSSITCYCDNISSIVVKWRPPRRPNGKITKYRISWRDSSNKERSNEYAIIGLEDHFRVKLSNVRKDPKYVVCVYAVNSAGISPKAQCFINTTKIVKVSITPTPNGSTDRGLFEYDDIKLGIIIGCIMSLLFVICLAIFVLWSDPCGCHRRKPLTQAPTDVETSVGIDNRPRYGISKTASKPDTNSTEVSDASSKQFQNFQKYYLEESSKESDRGLGMTPKNSRLCLDPEKTPFLNNTQAQDYSTGASFDSQDSGIQGLDKLEKGSSSSSSKIKDEQKLLPESTSGVVETVC